HLAEMEATPNVGDNDFTWHRVRPTGRAEDGMPALTLASELAGRGDAWAIVDGARTVAAFPRDRLRVSLSWKALVFEDDADRRRYDEHTDDIDLPAVLRRFTADLDTHGATVELLDDPVRDPRFLRVLQEHY